MWKLIPKDISTTPSPSYTQLLQSKLQRHKSCQVNLTCPHIQRCSYVQELWSYRHKGTTIRYPGGRARKNYEISKFLLKNGEKNTCTQAPCIYSVTGNVKEIFSRRLDVKYIIFHHRIFQAPPPPRVSNGLPLIQ